MDDLENIMLNEIRPKQKKEASAPPKAKAKAKAMALKAKTAVLKGIHSHKKKRKRSIYHPCSGSQRRRGSEGSLNILGRAPPGETSLSAMPTSSSPRPPSQP